MISSRNLRCATVGCGRIGGASSPGMARFAPKHLHHVGHLEAIGTLGIAGPLAACDLDPAKFEPLKGRFGITDWYTDIDALLRDFQPELLTIATRTPQKRAVVEAALQAGVRGIHLEKPLCNSPQELDFYRDLARRDDVVISNGCMRRYLAPFQAAQTLLDPETAGDVPCHASVSMGRGTLFWTLFHALDLVLFLAGPRKPVRVQAWMEGLDLDAEGALDSDPVVHQITLAFDDGMIGEISAKPGHTTAVFAGNRGLYLHADGRQAQQVGPASPDDLYLSFTDQIVDSGDVAGMQGPIRMLAPALHGDRAARDTLRTAMQDFLSAQMIAFACVESALSHGQQIPLETFTPTRTCWGKSGPFFA